MKNLRQPARLDFLLLVFILLLGASLRLLWIRAPLLDAHRWRQVDTASIARSLYEERFNVFYPQVNWGGKTATSKANSRCCLRSPRGCTSCSARGTSSALPEEWLPPF